ncbi:MAG: hypothetical protein ACFFF9_17235 [Candidatus Thorarchaeota archaeon]
MKRKRQIAIGILLTTIIIIGLIAFVTMDPRFLGIGMITEIGGLSHVSETYYPNDNVSYSVLFQEVNFTFLYWTYPYPLADAAYTAYFLVQFSDSTIEEINLNTGSYWAENTWPLDIKTTVHTSPKAGILYSGYLNKPTGWQFVVGFN